MLDLETLEKHILMVDVEADIKVMLANSKWQISDEPGRMGPA